MTTILFILSGALLALFFSNVLIACSMVHTGKVHRVRVGLAPLLLATLLAVLGSCAR